jgi:hypothetical protein|tara:strand:- start:108 stop:269 length:162 start_codon:yes stop_codon:yes gene_type:complete
MIGRADPGEHQYLGRADGPGAQDYLVALDDKGLSAAFQLYSGCPVSFEQDSVD